MNEPRYVDDEFGDGEMLDISRAAIGYHNLVVSAMVATGRSGKKFKDTVELHAWQKIEDMIAGRMISLSWAEYCIKWAEKKNGGQRATIITFPKLCKFIANLGKYDVWNARQDRGHPELSHMKTLRDL
jgi:hypothetical protein